MKHIPFAAAAVLLFGLGACTQVDQHADRPASSTSSTTPVTTPAATGMPQVATTPTGTPTPAPPSTEVPQAAPIAPATPTQKTGLNPPHGQPGHTCAIPVGAPLSSAPAPGAPAAPAAAPNVSVQPAPTTSAPAAPNVSVQTTPQAPINLGAGNAGAKGSTRINPPHGQPGHTCSVPVGQPIP